MSEIDNPLISLNAKTLSMWSCSYTNMCGEDLDISNLVMSVSIFESIFQETIIGHVLINDNIGFAEKQAIIGQGTDLFKIEVHTSKHIDGETSNFEKIFRVNSYHDIYSLGDGKNTTSSMFDLVSPVLYKNNRTRISRSFNSMTSSEIVDYLSYNILDLGTGIWDDLQSNTESKNTKNIVVPNWTPFKLMNFLTKNTVSVDGASNYLFFENNVGFHFKTIDELKEGEPVVSIDVSEIQKEQTIGPDMSVKINTAEKYQQISRFNHAKSMANGLYGGKLFTHNIITKDYNNYEIEYDGDEFSMGFAGLNGAQQFVSVPDSNLGFMPDEYLYQIHDKKDKSHYIHRDMKMAELRTNIVKFDIPGNTNIWAGDVIELNVSSRMAASEDRNDKFMSGNWLVTAIHHTITASSYVMTLECMKDSFENVPEYDYCKDKK